MIKKATAYKIEKPTAADYPELLQVWEASVRTSHHFLKEEDIQVFKPLILHQYFDLLSLFYIRVDQTIAGFLGTSTDKIEMLFVHPAYHGQQIGKQLLLYAIHELKLCLVDVNEQNEKALSYYRRFGFQVINRSAKDGLGKPYPLLHLQLL
ncbi:MAG TPA: GNAT family N-acetyltransferase [Flavisolibacter sp.]|nr:GNAT family N-acetyltransferase [Flavisolibacter sp.]